ncbi:hypothetical protein EVAR_33985_1 [Eumeta japonica]|uniref:Uncharacterized protein n=1 Tax=Eumeta variegata TaxID=151549 RepID=A0A4C1WZL2_EUMVA|nr:hypothetical protein EVAR_33985_1 [Eumeta japonica]
MFIHVSTVQRTPTFPTSPPCTTPLRRLRDELHSGKVSRVVLYYKCHCYSDSLTPILISRSCVNGSPTRPRPLVHSLAGAFSSAARDSSARIGASSDARAFVYIR